MLKKLLITLSLLMGITPYLVSQTQFSATKNGVRKSLIDGYFDSLKFKMPLGLPSYGEDSLKRAGELMTQSDTLKFRNSSAGIDRWTFRGASSGQFLGYDGRLWKPVSTVTSVGLSMPAIFSVANTPVTSTGTLTVTLVNQSQNLFWASPNGSTGSPSFRAVVSPDLSGIPRVKGYSAENYSAVDSVLMWVVQANITIDSIVAKQTGEGTVTINPKRVRSGAGVDLLSSNATVTTSVATLSGLQNGTLQNADQIWFRIKSITASTRQIFMQIYWHFTQ